jgi:hypothetical protein
MLFGCIMKLRTRGELKDLCDKPTADLLDSVSFSITGRCGKTSKFEIELRKALETVTSLLLSE